MHANAWIRGCQEIDLPEIVYDNKFKASFKMQFKIIKF